jgi:hypothetical protein
LDRYSPSPSPTMASAVPEDGWVLERESEHFVYYAQPSTFSSRF